MIWHFPIKHYQHQLPQDGSHPGAFGSVRKFDIHTGVDLYCPKGTPVFAVEAGKVVAIELFTGPRAESPWWHETLAILVEGESGVVCYGEVENRSVESGELYLQVGDTLEQGDLVTWAKQVLKKDKGKPMCMLHFELYEHGTDETVWWKKDDPRPPNLLDPTEKLFWALVRSKRLETT